MYHPNCNVVMQTKAQHISSNSSSRQLTPRTTKPTTKTTATTASPAAPAAAAAATLQRVNRGNGRSERRAMKKKYALITQRFGFQNVTSPKKSDSNLCERILMFSGAERTMERDGLPLICFARDSNVGECVEEIEVPFERRCTKTMAISKADWLRSGDKPVRAAQGVTNDNSHL